MPNSRQAIALALGDRYFVRFGKGGRVQTAWSLAGATLFLAEDLQGGLPCDKLQAAMDRLQATGKAVKKVRVGCLE